VQYPLYIGRPGYDIFQETQERTRKRIKEDLKDSTSAYNEYAEVILPKLKGRYLKKFTEVEVPINIALAHRQTAYMLCRIKGKLQFLSFRSSPSSLSQSNKGVTLKAMD